jgi:DNA processing protein
MRNDLHFRLGLLFAPGLGCRGINALLKRFPDPAVLFNEPGAVATESHRYPELAAYLRNPAWNEVERTLRWSEEQGNFILTPDQPLYPDLLAAIPDPPPVLFGRGDPEILALPQLAMIGSRNPTPSGQKTAFEFAAHLAGYGICVTSGLATGIDGASHQGALKGGGHTIAVTGTGLDRVYPARHRDLAHEICEQGAMVSEFPLGTPVLPSNFPRRNRIISGLSLGTLVVEAALKSGSLITARLAAEQGREVFAIPGSIHNPLARGCHRLIRQGAKLVEAAADILEELAPLISTPPHRTEEPESPGSTLPASAPDPEYQLLLKNLDYDPVSIDTLIERTGLGANEVSSMLLLLELEGHVSSVAGGRYCLTGRS